MCASFAPWQQAKIEIMLAISLTIACSRYMYYGVILHAHPVHGESHNQHNTTGEVATTSPPFYKEPHRSHVLCLKAWTRHHPHILVTAPFCCDRKSRAACAQSFAPWQQATIEIMLAISLTIACSRYMYCGVILHAHPIRGASHNQRNPTREVATPDVWWYVPDAVFIVSISLYTTRSLSDFLEENSEEFEKQILLIYAFLLNKQNVCLGVYNKQTVRDVHCVMLHYSCIIEVHN